MPENDAHAECPPRDSEGPRQAGRADRRGAAPEDIASARAALATAKAQAAVRDLLHLAAAERMQLAGLLLTGGGDGAT